MDCPATPPNIEDCVMLRTPSPSQDKELNTREDKNHWHFPNGPMNSGNQESDKTKSESKIKNEERCKSPDPTCAICLGQIENMSYTDSCLHKFCFTCLLEWSKVRPVCPLCKAKFKSIIHTIQSDNVYESYHLPPPPSNNNDNAQASRQEMAMFLEEIQRFRQNLSQQFRSGFASFQPDWRQRSSRDQEQTSGQQSIDLTAAQVLPSLPPFRFPSRTSSAGPLWNRRRGVATSAFRRNIYRQNLYVEAESITDITGRVRECSADWYRNNQAQTHRLVPWLNRELNALMESQAHQVPYVLQLILDLIQRFNIRSPEFHEQIVPYTGTRTNHFQHEFYNYARSTYDMIGYDRHAMYTALQPVETYVVSSESSSSEEEAEVQVDEPLVANDSSTINEDELIVVDETVSQPSSSNKEYISSTEINEPIASTSLGRTEETPQASFPLIISSDESDGNRGSQDNEVEVVDYVKPIKDRTPIIVNIESSGGDIIKKEKKIAAGVTSEMETANSSVTPITPFDDKSPDIVILGDSSSENNHCESSYKKQNCDKPLWKRNFETCFPKSSRDSRSKRSSKKRGKTGRKRYYPSSSSSDREKLHSSNNETFQRNGDSRKESKMMRASSQSSSSEEDEGGWFHQSGSSTEDRFETDIRPKSKGKGKGKGKSSKKEKYDEKVDNADNRPVVKTKNIPSKVSKLKSNRDSYSRQMKYMPTSESTSKPFCSDDEDAPLKKKKKESTYVSKRMKTKCSNDQPHVRKQPKLSKSSNIHAVLSPEDTESDDNSSDSDAMLKSTTPSAKNSPEYTNEPHKTKYNIGATKLNENALNKSVSSEDELFATKNSIRPKTAFDTDTSSVELSDSVDEYQSSSDKGNVSISHEKENQLRKRLIKKLENKQRSSHEKKVSSELESDLVATSSKWNTFNTKYHV